MKFISFQSEGQRVDGHLFIPLSGGEKYPGVLLLHGLTSSEANYIPIAERLSQNGIAAMTINMRGHGTSEGDCKVLSINDGVDDGLVAFDFFIKQEGVDKEKIGICGASFGATVAAMIAGKRNVNSMVLRAPATYTVDMMNTTNEKIMEHEKRLFFEISDPLDTPPLQAIQKFKGDLLVIASENDMIIPKRIPEAYLSAALTQNKELRVIAGASHNLNKNESWRKQFIDWSVDWFRNTL